jgi:hypothetical protein
MNIVAAQRHSVLSPPSPLWGGVGVGVHQRTTAPPPPSIPPLKGEGGDETVSFRNWCPPRPSRLCGDPYG